MIICQYCLKECKNRKTFSQHVIRCKLNPDRIKFHLDGLKKYNESGGIRLSNRHYLCKYCDKEFNSVGLLTGHITSCLLNPKSKETHRLIGLKNKGQVRSIDQRLKTSEAMRKSVLEGRHKTLRPGGISIGSWYDMKNGDRCYLHGTWEIAVAKFFDENNIVWLRPKEGFDYINCGKLHRYFPDFYLVDFDLYIEVKGYETELDHIKWQQFPKKLKIIRLNDYRDLKTWSSWALSSVG